MSNIRKKISGFIDSLVSRGAFVGIFFGILPALLLGYGGYEFLIEPGIAENKEATSTVLVLEEDVARGLAVEANEVAFRKEFKKTVELFYDSLPLLPKETELSNVMKSIQNVAVGRDVTIVGLEASKAGVKTPNADKLYEREISASVVGKYDDVMRFFMGISRQTRIMIVRDYDVVSVAKTKKQNSLTRPQYVSVGFTVLAYHAPPTNEFPSNIPPEIKQTIVQKNAESINTEKAIYSVLPASDLDKEGR